MCQVTKILGRFMRVMSSQRINGSTLVLPIEHCKRRHRQKRDKVRPGKKMPDARRGQNWTRAMENWPKPPTSHRRVHGPRTGGTGTREKKCPTPVVDGTGRAPWKTGQNHGRGTDAYTDPERAVRGHGKKVPDARRGRNWTRAMENRPKPPTSHRRVHGPVHGPRNGYEGSGKKRPIRHGNRAKTS